MSSVNVTEQSPLLGQYGHVQDVTANSKLPDGDETGCTNSLSPQDKQLSNARLALIMGSIWVRVLAFIQLGAATDWVDQIGVSLIAIGQYSNLFHILNRLFHTRECSWGCITRFHNCCNLVGPHLKLFLLAKDPFLDRLSLPHRSIRHPAPQWPPHRYLWPPRRSASL